jgi:uncharacterized protein (DUF433 family)
MNLTPEDIPVPVREDGHGGLRVGNTRVQLESVLACYERGEMPEEIVEAFPSLELADVYAVLAWVLCHPAEVAEYLKRRDAEAEALRRKLEAAGVTPTAEESERKKQELLARWAARQGQGDASAPE